MQVNKTQLYGSVHMYSILSRIATMKENRHFVYKNTNINVQTMYANYTNTLPFNQRLMQVPRMQIQCKVCFDVHLYFLIVMV